MSNWFLGRSLLKSRVLLSRGSRFCKRLYIIHSWTARHQGLGRLCTGNQRQNAQHSVAMNKWENSIADEGLWDFSGVDPRLIKNLVRCWLLRNATLGLGRRLSHQLVSVRPRGVSIASRIGLVTDVHWQQWDSCSRREYTLLRYLIRFKEVAMFWTNKY